MNPKELGTRVRRLRSVKGMSQPEFAKAAGTSQSVISRIENGVFCPDDEVLSGIARAAECEVGYLLAHSDLLASRPWLRAYADAPQKAVDRQLADVSMVVEAITTLQLRLLPERIPTVSEILDDAQIEDAARDTREAAGLAEDDVCGSAIRTAEHLGCVVVPMAEELGRHMGMSLRVNGIPVICAARASFDPDHRIPGDRQRFTVAHEIAHLVLHAGRDAPANSAEANLIERQAHRFAGAFLAPGDAVMYALRERGGKVTIPVLAEIKGEWGISIKALVMRFVALGVIDQDQARNLHKQISARGWAKNEPGDIATEYAVWLNQALGRRASADANPITEAADISGLAPSHLLRWTTWDPVTSAEIVQLRPASSTANRQAGRNADVADLSAARRQRRR